MESHALGRAPPRRRTSSAGSGGRTRRPHAIAPSAKVVEATGVFDNRHVSATIAPIASHASKAARSAWRPRTRRAKIPPRRTARPVPYSAPGTADAAYVPPRSIESQNRTGIELMGTAAASPPMRGPARRRVHSRAPTTAADKAAWMSEVVNMAHDCRRCVSTRHETAMNSASNLVNPRSAESGVRRGGGAGERALARC